MRSSVAPASVPHENPVPAEQLASMFADMGDGSRLGPLANALVARFPERSDSRYYHAAALFLGGRPAEAADEARRILAVDPRSAKARNLPGAACATIGQRDCAQSAFRTSIRINLGDSSTYVNLGFFRLQAWNPTEAAGSPTRSRSIRRRRVPRTVSRRRAPPWDAREGSPSRAARPSDRTWCW